MVKSPHPKPETWQLFVRRYLLKTFTEFDIDAVPAAEALAMMIYHGVEFEEAYPPGIQSISPLQVAGKVTIRDSFLETIDGIC